MKRKNTQAVRVGNVVIGGGAPISVQSMTCTKTEDVAETVAQILRLEDAGCEIVRVAVPSKEAADAVGLIREAIQIPLVADIHFDYKLALRVIELGVDKVRINPGNIGSRKRIEKVLYAAKERGIPIRIGVNSGSLEKDLLKQYGGVTPAALAESALRHVRICEEFNFEDIVISVKASDVPMMIETNRILAEKVSYPLHLGVTEAGTPRTGALRSAVGIGALLAEGIGDTIRVSLTGDPVEEVKAGFEILKSLHLREHGVTIISCPTCGRTQTSMFTLAEEVEKALTNEKKSLTVAIMGCAVNGPGEAKEADLGVACGKGSALLFRKGKTIRKIREDEIVETLVREVQEWTED
ncbi:flavodoxin-dependent (E)-4-hydroxy-3-methylbut-2-enyl-diphosphate synthase [candidate division KSB1 bacterium]|nr:flavodoxin-dependent (E)-4-hydroxy-3-methylbut-2-enyl-diphosphate synthase [candidate division KSB1 bacterium]